MHSNKDHSIHSDFFCSKRHGKAEGYQCAQDVAVSCCLSANLMATSQQGKVPTQDQELDHATKLRRPSSPESFAAELDVSQRSCAMLCRNFRTYISNLSFRE
jgi:hypothetical protein